MSRGCRRLQEISGYNSLENSVVVSRWKTACCLEDLHGPHSLSPYICEREECLQPDLRSQISDSSVPAWVAHVTGS
jgi:hypothetical protein